MLYLYMNVHVCSCKRIPQHFENSLLQLSKREQFLLFEELKTLYNFQELFVIHHAFHDIDNDFGELDLVLFTSLLFTMTLEILVPSEGQ